MVEEKMEQEEIKNQLRQLEDDYTEMRRTDKKLEECAQELEELHRNMQMFLDDMGFKYQGTSLGAATGQEQQRIYDGHSYVIQRIADGKENIRHEIRKLQMKEEDYQDLLIKEGEEKWD